MTYEIIVQKDDGTEQQSMKLSEEELNVLAGDIDVIRKSDDTQINSSRHILDALCSVLW